MKHPNWLDSFTTTASHHADKLTYGGSATAVAGGSKVLLWTGVADYIGVVAALVGMIAALIGLYFQWQRHRAMRKQEERDIREHEVKMHALQAAIQARCPEGAKAVDEIDTISQSSVGKGVGHD